MGRAQQRRLHADPVRGLSEDGSAEAVDRLEALLGGGEVRPGALISGE
jgi:hypothetical protein